MLGRSQGVIRLFFETPPSAVDSGGATALLPDCFSDAEELDADVIWRGA